MSDPCPYYEHPPDDPDAPVHLAEWEGLRPGSAVSYVGPMPMPGPLVVTALHRFPEVTMACTRDAGYVLAILNEGEYEVDAANLRAEP